jgi:hypothetical protein
MQCSVQMYVCSMYVVSICMYIVILNENECISHMYIHTCSRFGTMYVFSSKSEMSDDKMAIIKLQTFM